MLTKNARDLLFMNYLKKTEFDWKEGVVELINQGLLEDCFGLP
jgi:hypothetical protein